MFAIFISFVLINLTRHCFAWGELGLHPLWQVSLFIGAGLVIVLRTLKKIPACWMWKKNSFVSPI
jgi:hypothetical protein